MCPCRLEVTKGGPELPLDETKTSLFESALRRIETNLPLCRPRKPLVQSSLLVGRTRERKLETNQRKCRLKMTKFEANQRKEGPAERNALQSMPTHDPREPRTETYLP
jgi:hypothetical protein